MRSRISHHVTRTSSQVIGQNLVGGRARALTKNIGRKARPPAWMATVTATRRQVMRISQSMANGPKGKASVNKDASRTVERLRHDERID